MSLPDSHRILVVDDEPDWQRSLRDALETNGMRIDTAASVAEARDLIGRHRYAVVVLDLVLTPDFDGSVPLDSQTFLSFLRQAHPTLPVLAATGHPLHPTEMYALARMGIADFVSKKGIQLTDLRQRVERLIPGVEPAGASVGPVGRIFIGHGRNRIWLELKDYLVGLGNEVETYETAARHGMAAVEILRGMLHRSRIAFLIHTGEDETADGGLRARQNVVHETGLFQGRLGFDRAIILREEGVEAFSNLAGVHEIHFPKGDIRAAFGDVARALRNLT